MTEVKIKFNHNKLRGRIIEKYGSISKFSIAWGRSKNTVSKKLNNGFRFSSDDIVEVSDMLEIPQCEIGSYFFTKQV